MHVNRIDTYNMNLAWQLTWFGFEVTTATSGDIELQAPVFVLNEASGSLENGRSKEEKKEGKQ